MDFFARCTHKIAERARGYPRRARGIATRVQGASSGAWEGGIVGGERPRRGPSETVVGILLLYVSLYANSL